MKKQNKSAARANKAKMTKEELRALLPQKLNRLGEWILSNNELGVIHDMRAVLK